MRAGRRLASALRRSTLLRSRGCWSLAAIVLVLLSETLGAYTTCSWRRAPTTSPRSPG